MRKKDGIFDRVGWKGKYVLSLQSNGSYFLNDNLRNDERTEKYGI